MMTLININKYSICDILYEADQKSYSYQCPYLALADVLGYITPEQIRLLPSHFSRLSMKKMLRLENIMDSSLSNYIYHSIENGMTLKEIALDLYAISKFGNNEILHKKCLM